MSKILLVEDEELNRDMLCRRLKRRNFEVVTATDGAQACEIARAERPDLVLMDIKMPVMDGLEAARQLKADPQTRPIPIIGLSAHAMAEHRKQALDAGCDDYDTKPVELPRLLEKMDALLQRKSAP
jgi:two-component system, cell cycle response regulator DivK